MPALRHLTHIVDVLVCGVLCTTTYQATVLLDPASFSIRKRVLTNNKPKRAHLAYNVSAILPLRIRTAQIAVLKL